MLEPAGMGDFRMPRLRSIGNEEARNEGMVLAKMSKAGFDLRSGFATGSGVDDQQG